MFAFGLLLSHAQVHAPCSVLHRSSAHLLQCRNRLTQAAMEHNNNNDRLSATLMLAASALVGQTTVQDILDRAFMNSNK
jgi:hypothetical protein